MEKYFSNILKDLGLTDAEANVYNALLELGQSVVSPIAAIAHVNRTTCYNILESLVQKKMTSKSMYRGKQAYSADDPTRIIANLEETKKELEATLEKAKAFQPELTRRYAQKHTKPVIKYVEGMEGIKELYEDSLRCVDKKEGIRSYTSIRDLTQELGDYAQKYFTVRKQRNIPIRGILPDTEFGKQTKRLSKEYLRTVHLIPHEKFDFSPEIYLYDNKLVVFSFKERFGFLLESKEIVGALKIAWELAWERAGEYDEKIEF